MAAMPTPGAAFGPNSVQMTCPSCQTVIHTKLQKVSTTKTHIIAAILCVFLCWPCVFIPYCTDSCRNTNHNCPSCSAYLGTYSK